MSSSVSPSVTSAPGAAASRGPVAPAPKVDPEALVLHIDYFILAIFGVFFLLTIPRLIARYSRGSEWSLGHMLRAQAVPSARPFVLQRENTLTTTPTRIRNKKSTETMSVEETLTVVHSHINLAKHDTSLPKLPRSRSFSALLHPVTAILGHPVMPGYSVGRLIIMLGYFFTLVYAGTYKSSPFADPQRTGFIAMSQLPIVFALGTKNNIFGMFLSVGYEKLNYLHRFVGRLTALAANLHALAYFYKWSLAGTFMTDIAEPKFIHGLIALLGLDLLVFFSTAWWRENCYNIFMFSHIVGFIMFPTGLALHYPVTIPWVGAGVGIYVLDHIMRLFKTRVSRATLRPMPDLGLTRIEIPRLNAGWRAGQHVRLRVLSSGMGIIGWSEVHPFTIASVGGDGMVLMCKKAGGWTNKLYNLASGGAASEKGASTSSSAMVVLEGPYGGIGHTMMDKFSGALFVSGGSGITFSLAAIQDLVQKDIAGKSQVKVIELVWCVQTAASLESMLPTFISLVQQTPSTEIRISVYYTRASMVADPNKIYGYLPPNIRLSPGRPKIPVILDSVVDITCAATNCPTGFMVGVCGPVGLGEQVRKAVGKLDSGRRHAVGGVELCEEIFGW